MPGMDINLTVDPAASRPFNACAPNVLQKQFGRKNYSGEKNKRVENAGN